MRHSFHHTQRALPLRRMARRKGFTLTELAVVIGISTIIVAVTIPLYGFFQTYSALNTSREDIAQHIRLAETLARSNQGGTSYGIKFEPHQYTLFKGMSYATRSADDDRVFTVPSTVTLSGLSEITFVQHTGLPSAPATLMLTHEQSDTVETITINALGLIE